MPLRLRPILCLKTFAFVSAELRNTPVSPCVPPRQPGSFPTLKTSRAAKICSAGTVLPVPHGTRPLTRDVPLPPCSSSSPLMATLQAVVLAKHTIGDHRVRIGVFVCSSHGARTPCVYIKQCLNALKRDGDSTVARSLAAVARSTDAISLRGDAAITAFVQHMGHYGLEPLPNGLPSIELHAVSELQARAGHDQGVTDLLAAVQQASILLTVDAEAGPPLDRGTGPRADAEPFTHRPLALLSGLEGSDGPPSGGRAAESLSVRQPLLLSGVEGSDSDRWRAAQLGLLGSAANGGLSAAAPQEGMRHAALPGRGAGTAVGLDRAALEQMAEPGLARGAGGSIGGSAGGARMAEWPLDPNLTYVPREGGRQSFPSTLSISPDGHTPLVGVLRKHAVLPPGLQQQLDNLKHTLITGSASTVVPIAPVALSTADIYVNSVSVYFGFVLEKHPEVGMEGLCLQLLTNVHFLKEFLENECAREAGPGSRGLINKPVVGARWTSQGWAAPPGRALMQRPTSRSVPALPLPCSLPQGPGRCGGHVPWCAQRPRQGVRGRQVRMPDAC